MKKNVRLAFRKGDWLAIVLVGALALGIGAGYLPKGTKAEQTRLQVYQDGKLIHDLPMESFEEIDLQISGDYKNIVTMREGKVAITESDCPGTDCVYTGWISEPGRSIVCLPNRVEVRLVGNSDVDFVVR